MGLLDRFTKKSPLVGGQAGVATVTAARRDRAVDDGIDEQLEPDDAWWKYTLDVTVQVDGRAPYDLQTRVKVPNPFLPFARGVDLPVRVDPDDAQRIEIDWDAFGANGGGRLVAEAYQKQRDDRVDEIVHANPAIRANILNTIEELLGEVEAGRQSASELSGYLEDWTEARHITAEEAAAFRARAEAVSKPPG